MTEETSPAVTDAVRETPRGVVAWFARNPVAANMMMAFIIISGIYSLLSINRTLMPDFDIDWVRVTVFYPGASPAEAEEGVTLKIEEELRHLQGISHISAYSFESHSQVNAKVESGYSLDVVRSDIKAAIDQIATFPREAEPPVISKLEAFNDVAQLEIWGDLDPISLKNLAREVKNELLALPEITKTRVYGMRDYEISVEVSEQTLLKYGLTLGDIAKQIDQMSLNLPSGTVRTEGGHVSIRSVGQRYREQDFSSLTLITRPDGTRLRLGDIATIRDGFVDISSLTRFNGQPSIGITALAQKGQDMIEIAEAMQRYARDKQPHLPEGVNLTLWADTSYYIDGRINLMLRNLLLGAVLVFLVLVLFIDCKLAFWVMVGVLVSFLGAFALAPQDPFGVTANLVSMFALILVLGVVVDDAIVIGECATATCDREGYHVNSVIRGAHRVLVPAVFGVLTTVVAFSPTLLVTGPFADMPQEIGYVVTLCLLFSLIESKWILPAHLAHTKPSTGKFLAPLRALQTWSNRVLQERVIDGFYCPLMRRVLELRYLNLSIFTAILIISIALVASGFVRFSVVTSEPSDFILASVEMVEGTPDQITFDNLRRMEDELRAMDLEYQRAHGESFLLYLNVWSVDGLNGHVFGELQRNMRRPPEFNALVREWRARVPRFPGAKLLAFGDAAMALGGGDVSLRVASENLAEAERVAAKITAQLATYPGVHSVQSNLNNYRDELHISIKPNAEALGLTQQEVASQIRHAFYGAEAQRIQRDQEDIRVMVRYPRKERETLSALRDMRIRAPDGSKLALSSVAEVSMRTAPSQLSRVDGMSAVNISAFVDTDKGSPGTIVSDLMNNRVPDYLEGRGDTEVRLNESSKDQSEMVTFLLIGFLFTTIFNYALLAVPLRSYIQPLVIMSVIPFGIVGAIVGHMLMGLVMSMVSVFGIIALSGVVVNDSLILVDFINKAIASGTPKRQAVIEAGASRYRAIMLTSLTTFFGLLPIMMEDNTHARFVLPMAVSLAFGIIFATVITLLLVPCMYIIMDDVVEFRKRLFAFKTWRLNRDQT